MAKEVKSFDRVEQEILDAISMVADPVVQTLSPRGGNVMLNTTQSGTESIVTNDGITIARSVRSSDKFKDSIIKIIQEACLRTNTEAGDGTTTSILLTSVLLREGLRLRREGVNPMVITKVFRESAQKLIERIKEQAKVAETDSDILSIATVSANSDPQIAELTLKTVKTAGVDGMVFIEPSRTGEDEIVEDLGFILKSGMFRPELRTDGFVAHYSNVPVLVTDKRLYYKQEAETILSTVYQAGHKEVVIIARDFLGDCLNTLIANHTGGAFKILMVKDNTATDAVADTLTDLAVYLDTHVNSEKSGHLVDKLKFEDFAIADKVFSDGHKTIIGRDNKVKANAQITMHLDSLRKELKKDPNDDVIKSRIASLTSGMVTLRIAGATATEVQERIFRFEDAVNASRAAMKHGYLPGGGVALMNAYNEGDYPSEYRNLFKKYTEASVRQIAKNCGKDPDTIIETIKNLQEDLDVATIGYDALSGQCLDMVQQGVLDPYQVLKLAIENSVSAACNILSVNYYIINEPDEDND